MQGWNDPAAAALARQKVRDAPAPISWSDPAADQARSAAEDRARARDPFGSAAGDSAADRGLAWAGAGSGAGSREFAVGSAPLPPVARASALGPGVAASARGPDRLGIVGGLAGFADTASARKSRTFRDEIERALQPKDEGLYKCHLSTFQPYLHQLVQIENDLGVRLAREWAGSSLYGGLVGRGGHDGSWPCLGADQDARLRHRRVVALFNNPVGDSITDPGARGRNNDRGFYGGVAKLATTLHYFGEALYELQRPDVPFFDLWPFVAEGLGVGAQRNEEPCRRAAAALVEKLADGGARFFLVATGAGWSTFEAALQTQCKAQVRCEVEHSGERFEVLVLAVSSISGTLFCVKCPHFCTWPQYRKQIVAALVCVFELAGQEVGAERVARL